MCVVASVKLASVVVVAYGKLASVVVVASVKFASVVVVVAFVKFAFVVVALLKLSNADAAVKLAISGICKAFSCCVVDTLQVVSLLR